MIRQTTIAQALDLAIARGATDISPDIQAALEMARDSETSAAFDSW